MSTPRASLKAEAKELVEEIDRAFADECYGPSLDAIERMLTASAKLLRLTLIDAEPEQPSQRVRCANCGHTESHVAEATGCTHRYCSCCYFVASPASRLADAEPEQGWQETAIEAYWKAQEHWSGQCFCFTSAPESMRREAHEVARDGFNEIVNALGPIVRPLLNEEYWQAVRAAKAAKSAPPRPSSPAAEEK